MKYALRQLAKSPGFTLVAILTLALGIGANTAIFSFVNTWILHPLPFDHPEQIVVLFETDKKTGNTGPVSPADWKDWQEKSNVFDQVAAMDFTSSNLTGVEEPEKVPGFAVSANFFKVLGIKPALGREFTEAEQIPGSDNVAILSHDFWRDRFASDPNIIGRKITLDGAAVTVIGVLPSNFQYIPMGGADVLTPLALSPAVLAARDSRFLETVGRLKPGVDLRGARAALISLQDSLERTYPVTNANRGIKVAGLREEINRQSGNDATMIVYAIVCFVLLMACANVANLVMARATGRRKEMAVRLAIGAGRWRLVRQLLTETLILFVAGAAAGVAFALWGVQWLENAITMRSRAYLPNHGMVDVDWQVLLFTLGIALLTGLAFGLAPALEGTRFDVNNTLKDSSARGTGSLSGGRFRRILVAGEMAMAVMVVVCGALLVNSFVRMMQVDLGFRGERVLVAELQLPPKYATDAAITQFYDKVLERLTVMPGVERAAASLYTPGGNGGERRMLFVEGRPELPAGQTPTVRSNRVTPGYLEAMSIPLVAGRTIERRDSSDGQPAVVVGETLVKRHFNGENPLGKRIRLSRRDPTWFTIVGVVKDVKYFDPSASPENQAYLPFAQVPSAGMSLVVRMSGDPSTVAQSIRSVVRSVDPNQPVSRILTIATQIEERNAPNKILTQITAFFGGLALFLAAIGIYGVMAYSVSQRTQEIGVRMALGAQSRDVLALIVRQGMGVVLGGMLAGIAGAVVMARLMARFLFGIGATDPATFAVTIAILASIALLACWIPARRASKVDPLAALHYE